LYADFLFMCLRAEVPGINIFRDSDTLKPGVIFSEAIEEAIANCDVLIAIIGKKWLGVGREGARRIDSEDDWVRQEVATALEQKKLVIPCLVGGARLPKREELPPNLAGLTARHMVTLTQKDLRRDAQGLIEHLTNWKRASS
jgi:hypothetical protein